MAFFKSKAQDDIATVRGKLEQARADRAKTQAELDARALEFALSADIYAAAPFKDARDKAEERVRLLETALQHAGAAEAQRIAEAKAAERQSAHREIQRRIGSIAKAAQKYEVAVLNEKAAWHDILEHQGKILSLLAGSDREFAAALGVSELVRYFEAERNRILAEHPVSGEPSAPGSEWKTFTNPKSLAPLSQRLRERLEGCHRILTGQAPPPPSAAPAQPAVVAEAESQEEPVALSAEGGLDCGPIDRLPGRAAGYRTGRGSWS